ncbi:MAG TPA: hypothetical protein VMV10_12560 [Pirellulales bacterium]|nr:hypothetical protein [Pirellulales bacterium]
METNPHQAPSQPEPRPGWVKLGLWGLPNRGSAWACFWLSGALGLGGAYGFVDPRFFGFGSLFFAASWYWLAIRWVDEHGGWASAGQSQTVIEGRCPAADKQPGGRR